MFNDLHPQFAPWASWLYQVAGVYGLNPRVTSTFRSVAHQQRLYDRYLRGDSIYPVARPGCSWHNYGLAFDMVADNAEWLGRVWQSVGGSWGGPYDPIHFGVKGRPCP